MNLAFELLAKDEQTAARRTRFQTAHGVINTPVFMPVGTWGSVRTLTHENLESCDVTIILGNTYHLFLRPGAEVLKTMGGYHKFIGWNRPVLTDSGGFQIFSLPHQRVISEKGATFKSYIDQSYQFLSPEIAIQMQETIGSDIMMALDVCIPSTSERSQAFEAMERTHRWAKRCLQAKTNSHQHLFGIVQGTIFEDLRKESAQALVAMNFDGYAIGGLAVGENDEQRNYFTQFTASLLPEDKPRYLMGVGTPHDLVRAVAAGVDMFDCIIPTNHAKQGVAYTWNGKVKLRRRIYVTDNLPLDENCSCYVCRRYSRAYLYQLLKCDEPTGWHYISYHNIWFYKQLTLRMQNEIEKNPMAHL